MREICIALGVICLVGLVIKAQENPQGPPPAQIQMSPLERLQKMQADTIIAEDKMKTKALEAQAATVELTRLQAGLMEIYQAAEKECQGKTGGLKRVDLVWKCEAKPAPVMSKKEDGSWSVPPAAKPVPVPAKPASN